MLKFAVTKLFFVKRGRYPFMVRMWSAQRQLMSSSGTEQVKGMVSNLWLTNYLRLNVGGLFSGRSGFAILF